MKRKGFTLIELIAVIVILAIITLVAIPVITGIVNKSKKGAAEASALNYIDAVEKYVMLHDLDATKYPYDLKNNTFNVSSNTEVSLLDIIIPKAKAENTIPALNSFIIVKGDKPKNGTITTNEKGRVIEADLVFGKFGVECTGGKCEASTERTSVVIDGDDNLKMVAGDTLELNAVTNSDKAITWTSSDNTVATVNNGVVTAIKEGNVTIKAKVEKAEAIVTINVENVSVSIDGDKPRNASKGTNLELSVTTNSKNSITWTSSDNTVATVSNGVVSPLKYGSVTITAAIGDASDSVTLNIKTGATKEAAPSGATYKGIVYLNPKNLDDHCTASNSYSNTERKEGCMKWYIFDDSTSKYKMILDHNTTARIYWKNDLSKASYAASNIPGVLVSYGWDNSLNLRIITGNEVASMISPNSGWTTSSQPGGIQIGKNYAWLAENTYHCFNTLNCASEDNNSYSGANGAPSGYTCGYWTSSLCDKCSTGGWFVYGPGPYFTTTSGYSQYSQGIRPVIEVDKSIIN